MLPEGVMMADSQAVANEAVAGETAAPKKAAEIGMPASAEGGTSGCSAVFVSNNNHIVMKQLHVIKLWFSDNDHVVMKL